jgi:hypothetical protein
MGLRALIKKQPTDLYTGKALTEQNAQTDPSPVGDSTPRRRTLGGWEDIWIAEDFDETPEDFLKYFTGEESLGYYLIPTSFFGRFTHQQT